MDVVALGGCKSAEGSDRFGNETKRSPACSEESGRIAGPQSRAGLPAV